MIRDPRPLPERDRPAAGDLIADRRLWLDAAGVRVVEDGDERAAVQLSAPGQVIPRVTAERLGLSLDAQQRVHQTFPETKQTAPSANKLAPEPPNKTAAPTSGRRRKSLPGA